MAAAMAPEEQGKWVKLISQEGHEFIVDRNCAMVSGTIKVRVGRQECEFMGWLGCVVLVPFIFNKRNEYNS
jgi:hypothetical protein